MLDRSDLALKTRLGAKRVGDYRGLAADASAQPFQLTRPAAVLGVRMAAARRSESESRSSGRASMAVLVAGGVVSGAARVLAGSPPPQPANVKATTKAAIAVRTFTGPRTYTVAALRPCFGARAVREA